MSIKKIFLILIFFQIVPTGFSTAQIRTISFYNVENLFDTVDDPKTNDEEFLPKGSNQWDETRYLNKLDKISSVFAALNPDISGISEVENRKVLEDLLKQPRLASKGYQIVHFDSRDYRGIDVALLYKPAVFQPFSTAMLPINAPNEPKFITRDILLVKGLLDGDTLTIFVNHWPSRRGGKEDKRLLAAQVLRSAVDSLQRLNPQANIICVGDFNDDPTNKSMKKILLAGGNTSKLEEGYLYNTGWSTFKKGYGTGVYNGAWNMFDQIVITPSLLSNNKAKIAYINDSFTIFAPKWMQVPSGPNQGSPYRNFSYGAYQNGYSDHYPVFIRLKISE